MTQFQVVQTAPDQLDVRLVSARPGTPDEEQKLRDIILARIGGAFSISFSYADSIPRGPGGKFEDFRSEVA